MAHQPPVPVAIYRLLPLLLFSACTTAEFIQHTPTLANTGMHRDKGDFAGRFFYSTGSASINSSSNSSGPSPYDALNGLQAQGSVAAGRQIALQVSHMYSREKGGSTENGNHRIVYNYRRNITEAGLAWFYPFGPKKDFFMEIAGGTGLGRYTSSEVASLQLPGGRFYNHNVFKLYFQPTVYFRSRHFNAGAGMKFARQSFGAISTNYSSDEKAAREILDVSRLNTGTTEVFFRLEWFPKGLEWLGISAHAQQGGETSQKMGGNINDSNFGLGLCFRLTK